MKKIALILLVICLATSCASVGSQSNQYQVQATTNGEVGTLEGESVSHYLFWGLICWGDSGVVTAAKNSGGRYIRTVDQKFDSFLGLYSKLTTFVTTENTPSEE